MLKRWLREQERDRNAANSRLSELAAKQYRIVLQELVEAEKKGGKPSPGSLDGPRIDLLLRPPPGFLDRTGGSGYGRGGYGFGYAAKSDVPVGTAEDARLQFWGKEVIEICLMPDLFVCLVLLPPSRFTSLLAIWLPKCHCLACAC